MRYALLTTLLCLALGACATTDQPSDLANRARLGAGNTDVTASGWGAVATTRRGARLHDYQPGGDAGGDAGGGTVEEPVVLWNPVTQTWEPQFGPDGKPLMKVVKGLRDYNNYVGSTLTVSATGSGTTSGQQSQAGTQTSTATPTNTTDTDGTITPGQ